MLRVLSLLLLFACFAPALSAQETPAAEAPAALTFEQTTIDYGTIEQNADPYRTFAFTNTSSEPVLITNAVGSCGCTVPSYSEAPIAPGESGEVKVRYATDRVGKFRKRVTLTTSADEQPIVLTIMGEVTKKPVEPAAVPAGEQSMFNGSN